MKATQAISALAFAAQAQAHGYIYRVTSDNTVYPGYDIFIDPQLDPAPSRIAYGGGTTGPVFDADSADVACGPVHSPTPGFIAQARAGSNVTFHWSRWLYSHKGPITAWMAPYEGDVADVDVNELEFFKFAEEAADENGVWGTVKLLDETNGAWTATIPADIKPGTYIIRQEASTYLNHSGSLPAAILLTLLC
ncbi:Cellulose-growth-specific protein [Madurella mycetomatis]|uniref:lytic cellulose monooxygenase (C4-dehydrogenating) n=1 Tax=Madurella mycetomatis TaxID=100816 RepID=A0A175W0T1_9PEZI|nr:Cellulose-growth-specific protein [Madurella mycetomatis]